MSKQTEETAARTVAQETFDHAYQHPRLPGYRCAQCGATAADHARAEQTTSAPREAGEHTPGPWTIWQHVDGDRSIKQIGQKLPDGRLGEMVAANVPAFNARLIASAPDLLAENARLREQVAELMAELGNIAKADLGQRHPGLDSTREFMAWAQNRARAVLAKAERRAQ